MHKKLPLYWFLLGLGGKLQVIASLSISEIAVLLVGPMILLSEYPYMKKTRVVVFWHMSVLLVLGCAVACIANNTQFQYVVRGFATTILMLLSVVVAHRLFRLDMSGFRWYFLGDAISMILCTFVFQRFGELEAYGGGAEGMNAVASIMSGPLFWIQRLGAFVRLPGVGWYLTTPLWISAGGALFMSIFSLLTTTSGRSAAINAVAACVIILIGRRKRSTMMKISKHFYLLLFAGAFCILFLNLVYRYAAEGGYLGESAHQKYEAQTQRGKDVFSLIMGGRSDSFIGLLACRDKPITGWGPWAVDTKGYKKEFMDKYGTWQDYQEIIRSEAENAAKGGVIGLIQCHSYIVEFWVWYGIFGLIYWLYAIYVFIRYLRQDIAAVPQWFFWLAAGMPGMLWAMFFSPLMGRIGVPMFIVACLVARAVRQGRLILPVKMIQEIEKAEAR